MKQFEHIIHYKIPIRHVNIEKGWHWLMIVSIFASLVIFIVNVTMGVPHYLEFASEFIEFFALTVLAVDLFMEFVAAKDKFVFVKKNWLLILALIPLARIVEVGQATRLAELFRFGSQATEIEYMGVTGVSIVQRGLKASVHTKHLAKEMKKR